jgi:hypothetical protein
VKCYNRCAVRPGGAYIIKNSTSLLGQADKVEKLIPAYFLNEKTNYLQAYQGRMKQFLNKG